MKILQGDSREVLRTLADNSIDSVVTDPPYALVSIVERFGAPNAAPAISNGATGVYARAGSGFMGKTWDTGETAFSVEFWLEVMRVLKPGGHVIAFGGTRTYHRLACAIEDAGFEIRDMLSWLYGTGFPKSHNQKDEWDGWGTALKPALEPIVFARKPLSEKTVAANVLRWRTGAINIDGCRVATNGEDMGDPHRFANCSEHEGWSRPSHTPETVKRCGERSMAAAAQNGRWPANVMHDGSDEVVRMFPNSNGQQGRALTDGSPQNNTIYGALRHGTHNPEPRGDSGSAARFFYSAKASKTERNGSKHPTVKPIALMQWLCRLVTPPGGVVLDPFAGTGTTGAAAIAEGFDCIMIEREAEYVADMNRRFCVSAFPWAPPKMPWES